MWVHCFWGKILKKVLFAVLLCTSLLLSASFAVAVEKPLVAFANPASKTDAFWELVTSFMQAAADDLGFELKVYYADRNHVLIDENVNSIYSQEPRPDFVIGMNARGSGTAMLELGEATGIKTVFINQSFLTNDRTLMGLPGERYKNWLFEYLPDDVHSGYLLAKTLIDDAFARGLTDTNGMLQIVGVTGHELSSASILRVQGLKKAVAEYPNVVLDQLVKADWKRDRAHDLALGLIGRYPEIGVFWSASDVMSMGVIDAIGELGKVANKDILTGGVDWANSALPLVKGDVMTASVGGHFMDGGWALVMLYDLIHGEEVPPMSLSRFSVLTKGNVDIYSDRFGGNDWSQIDFRKFSKHLNPKVKEYDFGLEAVLNQVR